MYLIRLHLGYMLIYFIKKGVKRVKVIYGVLKPGSVRNLVLPLVYDVIANTGYDSINSKPTPILI